jgi:hypothetical protein
MRQLRKTQFGSMNATNLNTCCILAWMLPRTWIHYEQDRTMLLFITKRFITKHNRCEEFYVSIEPIDRSTRTNRSSVRRLHSLSGRLNWMSLQDPCIACAHYILCSPYFKGMTIDGIPLATLDRGNSLSWRIGRTGQRTPHQAGQPYRDTR